MDRGEGVGGSASEAPRQRLGCLLLVAWALLAGVRNWIALGGALPLGPVGDPADVRDARLSGWLSIPLRGGGWDPPRPLVSFVWEWVPALLFGTALWLLLPRLLTLRLPRRLTRLGSSPALLCAALTGLSAFLSLFCFQGIPHVQDSIAQQFQAQLFAAGHAYVRVPPHGEFFSFEFLVQEGGRWFAQYPPVHAAALAVGVFAGVPWLVNPVLGGAAAWCVYLAAGRMYGRRTGELALVLFCASPFVWFMSAERMNHASALFWSALAMALLAPLLRENGERLAIHAGTLAGAGAALGLAAGARPLCALAVALPLAYFALSVTTGTGRRLWRIALLGAGAACGFAPTLVFNALTTGSAWRSGYEAQWGTDGWGFGDAQWGPPHTVVRGLEHLLGTWDAANKYVFQWPLPSLLPLLGLLLLPRLRRGDRTLLASLFCLSAVYFPYFFQDLCLGPRFLYSGLPAFVILGARGLLASGATLGRRSRWGPIVGARALRRAAALCTAAGLAANLPLLLRWFGSSYWGTSTMVLETVERAGIHRAIVFIQDHNRARVEELRRLGVSYRTAHGAVQELDDTWIDQAATQAAGSDLERVLETAIRRGTAKRVTPPWLDRRGPSSSFNHGQIANTPWPERQDVIYALDRGPRNQLLRNDYPGRSAWIYRWDEGTRGFRLLPLAPVKRPRDSSGPGAPGTARAARPGTSRLRC